MDRINNSTKTVGDKVFIAFIAVIALLLALRDIGDLNINQYLVLAIFTAAYFVLPYEKCAYLTACSLPLFCGLQGFVATVAYAAMFFKAPQKNTWQWIPTLFILIIELISWNNCGPDISIKDLLLFVSFVGLFFFLIGDTDSVIDKRLFIKFFIISSCFALSLIVARSIIYHGANEFLTGAYRGNLQVDSGFDSDVQTHFNLNANSQAFYSIVNLAILLLGRKNLRFSPALYYLAFSISVIAGIVSFSRTWVLLTALLVIISVVISKGKRRLSLVVLFAVVGLLFANSKYSTVVFNSFEGRFTNENMETAGGRIEIFQHYNELWLEDISTIIVGTGSIDYVNKSHYNHSIHNGTQQIYYCFGVIGFIVFLLSFRNYFKKDKVRKRKLSYLPFIICFLFDQSIQFVNPLFLMFPFITSLFATSLELDN